jgi:tRNA(Arg) A34 adenosine deaminase TadA
MCDAAMKFVGIKKVVYSTEDGKIESMRIYNE